MSNGSNKATIGFDAACAALTSGLNAALWHPWDRACYLAMRHRRSFFVDANWSNWTFGIGQSTINGIVNKGSYFFMQKFAREQMQDKLEQCPAVWSAAIGAIIGTINGVITNPLTVIRAESWSYSQRYNKNISSGDVSKNLWRAQGIRAFSNGATDRGLRYLSFGAVYELARYACGAHDTSNEMQKLATSTYAAILAAITSSPFNYTWTMKCGNILKGKAPVPTMTSLMLLLQMLKEPSGCIALVNKLGIGQGTLRVAGNMGLNQVFFDFSQNKLPKLLNKVLEGSKEPEANK